MEVKILVLFLGFLRLMVSSVANPFDSRNFCVPPAAPANGKVSFGGGHLISRYKCDKGFKIIGSSVAVCVGGKWSATTPTCRSVNNKLTKLHGSNSNSRNPLDVELKDQQIVTVYTPPNFDALKPKTPSKTPKKKRKRKRRKKGKKGKRRNRNKKLHKKKNVTNKSSIGELSENDITLSNTNDGGITSKVKGPRKKRKRRRRKKNRGNNRKRKKKNEGGRKKGRKGKKRRQRKKKKQVDAKPQPPTPIKSNDVAPFTDVHKDTKSDRETNSIDHQLIPQQTNDQKLGKLNPKKIEQDTNRYDVYKLDSTTKSPRRITKKKQLLETLLARKKNEAKRKDNTVTDLLKSETNVNVKAKNNTIKIETALEELSDYEEDYEGLPNNYVDPYGTKDGAIITETINPSNNESLIESLPEGYPTVENRLINIIETNGAKDRFMEQENIDFSQLDTTCIISEIDSLYLPPPRLPNGHITAYISVTNPAKPNNVYVEAIYDCNFGYQLADRTNSRLFCLQDKWIGLMPVCKPYTVSDEGACGEDNGGCEHICHPNTDEVLCSCYRGFTLTDDKVSCRDVNECEDDNGGCEGACFNKLGSFQCYCPKGYRISTNGKTCLDKNECILRNGHGPCQDSCHNTQGSYSCTCDRHPGTKLASDNHTCEDVNECDNNNGGCSHICLNTFGQTFCGCPDGYILGMDWKTCEDVNECEYPEISKTCQHTCLNTPGSYSCVDLKNSILEEQCSKGYYLNETTKSCTDIDECQTGSLQCSHICTNTIGTAMCQCPNGFQLSTDKLTCEDMDECKEISPCSDVCSNTIGSYSCSCLEGYELSPDKISCVDINECTVDNGNCDHLCRNIIGSHYCECNAGFLPEADGSCQDIDECETENGRCQHICSNKIGTFECSCFDGYELDGTSECLDINECDDKNLCEYQCENTEGSFTCSCPQGYEVTNKLSCIDVDECDSNQKCSHFCSNANGSFACSCPRGLRLDTDKHTCIDINECNEDISGCSHFCENSLGGYYCSCPQGMELIADGDHHENNHTCIDINECEENYGNCTGICENYEGYYTCSCEKGYQIFEENSCEDVNECEEFNGHCSHRCVNEEGTFHCVCPFGYEITSDNLTCSDVDECQIENGGCSHLCINMPGTYQCECPVGWKTDLTDYDEYADINNDNIPIYKTCIDSDECSILNGGCSHTCTNTEGSYLCSCPEGYKLMENYYCEDINECHNGLNACSHKCVNLPGSFRCECPLGFELFDSARCMDIDECSKDNGGCDHHCINVQGSKKCSCKKGYILESDNMTCSDINECGKENGGCSHDCRNTNGNFECVCPNGMFLDINNKTCIDINECDNNNGGCSHECRNSISSFHCACPQTFRLSVNGKTCIDVDECGTNNGGCSHQCLNQGNEYSCLCPQGLELAEDDHTCVDVDECTKSNGGCSHTCINTIGGYGCGCPTGFQVGIDNSTCHDTDECLNNNAGCEDVCINTRGSFRCDCGSGYSLSEDNFSCEDTDECSIANGGCSHECSNSIGSFQCRCPFGYSLNEAGNVCIDINECNEDVCEHTCLNTPGSYYCECGKGYSSHPDSYGQCHDVDECLEGVSGCSQLCYNEIGSYRCGCLDKYVLESDKHSCKAKKIYCSRIIPPLYSDMTCSHEMVENMYPEGTTCTFKCEEGKVIRGEKESKCTEEGAWTNDFSTCATVKCAALSAVEHGKLAPRRCVNGLSNPGQHCYLTCQAGYRVFGNPVSTCQNSGEWSPSQRLQYCEKVTMEPYIQCPKDITVELAPHQKMAYVRIPQPKSNVDWHSKLEPERFLSKQENTESLRFLDASPKWGKDLEADLPAGRTKVSFTARSPISEATATCSFVVFIKDGEIPQVFGCPKSFRVYIPYGETTVEVNWREPMFKDNVDISHVYKSMEPGRKLAKGVYPIHYIAVDPQGNRAKCSFVITVEAIQQPTPFTFTGLMNGLCGPDPGPILGGMWVCSDWAWGRMCKPECSRNDILVNPTSNMLFMCYASSGDWIPDATQSHSRPACTRGIPVQQGVGCMLGYERRTTHKDVCSPDVKSAQSIERHSQEERTPRVSVYEALAISDRNSDNRERNEESNKNIATALSTNENYQFPEDTANAFYGNSNIFSHILQNSNAYALAHARSGKKGSTAFAKTKADGMTQALAHARAQVYNYR